MELLSDGHTAAPLIRMAYLHSVRGGRSYFLHFRHQTNERDFPQVSIKAGHGRTGYYSSACVQGPDTQRHERDNYSVVRYDDGAHYNFLPHST